MDILNYTVRCCHCDSSQGRRPCTCAGVTTVCGLLASITVELTVIATLVGLFTLAVRCS